jgi:dipeptidyl aminopeptidase/acylaminoacyl peptidase
VVTAGGSSGIATEYKIEMKGADMAKTRKRRITAEDLYRLLQVGDCRISPDGEHVVFSVQRVDRKTEKKYTNLWVVPAEGGKARQFTYGNHSDTQPRWSPDGNRIAFLSNRENEKQSQIYVIPFAGGEARRVTDMKGSFASLEWSPDGRRFLCQFRKKDQEEIEREKDEQKKKLGVVARHYDRVFFKLDGAGLLPIERWHLWVIQAGSGRAKQITSSPVYDETEARWSPDGKQVVFVSNRSKDPDLDPYAIDIFIAGADGGSIRRIPTPEGNKGMPSFSPDGKHIAYFGSEDKGRWWKNMGLWVVPVGGRGKARNLTAKFDFHVSSWTINDLPGTPEWEPAVWSADGHRIYFQVSVHGDTRLMSIARSGTRSSLETVIGDPGVVGSFSLDRGNRRMAFFRGNMVEPGDVYAAELETGDSRRLTRVNSGLLDRIDLGQTEEVWFKGGVGNDLQGWIVKPPGFRKNRKYPAILEIHGGPLVQYGNFFMHEFYYLAAQGYVVFFCNPRGGQGYGENHAKAIWNKWGTADYDDLMAFTDYVRRRPYVDGRRMGVTGGSYGGFMTNWIIGHTRRFRAAVTQRCVSNLISMWGSSDFNWIFQEEVGGKPPWENLSNYWRQSPMKHIGNARTPTLVMHSEQDQRCAIEQGEQVFVALKQLGVDTEMVRFPDEPHGLSRGGRTDRRIERLKHIVRWFDRYLKG